MHWLQRDIVPEQVVLEVFLLYFTGHLGYGSKWVCWKGVQEYPLNTGL